MEQDRTHKGSIFNKDTLIPVSMVIVLVAACWWIQETVFSIKLEIHDVKHTITGMNLTLEQASRDRWTHSDMVLWTTQFRAANSELEVPNPDRKK